MHLSDYKGDLVGGLKAGDILVRLWPWFEVLLVLLVGLDDILEWEGEQGLLGEKFFRLMNEPQKVVCCQSEV